MAHTTEDQELRRYQPLTDLDEVEPDDEVEASDHQLLDEDRLDDVDREIAAEGEGPDA